MFRRFRMQSDAMALSIVLWLCALPLVGIVVLPLFGREMALIVAIVLFLVALAVCWGICGWKLFQSQDRQ